MNKCIGIQYKQYTSKKTGQQVTGYNVYYTYPSKGCDGVCCDSLWASVALMDESPLRVGDEFEALYNRYGRVESIRISG